MMEHEKMDSAFTVQGADPPVPVGEGGVRVGPPRPSSNDYPAPSVANQAGVQAQETGDMAKEAFKRCFRTARSPMRAVRSLSVGELDWRTPPMTECVVPVDRESTAGTESGAKRKRMGDKGNENLKTEPALVKLVKEMLEEVSNLQRLASEHISTHKKIKESSRKLSRIAGKIEREDFHIYMGAEAKCQKTLDTQEASCQTDVEDLKKNHQYITDIASVRDYRDFSNVAKGRWPDQIYRSAFIAKGSPLGADEDADLLVLVEEKTLKGRNEGIRKAFEDRYPELPRMEGKMSHLIVSSTYTGGNGQRIVKERTITRAVVEGHQEEWFNTLKCLSDVARGGPRKKIAIYPPGEDNDGEWTRKMAECVFRDSGIRCLIYIKEKGKGESTGKPKDDNGGPRGLKRTDAIIINTQQSTYADLLKSVKDTIKAGTNAAKGIRTIRKTKNNELLIVVDKESTESTKELRQEIERKYGAAAKFSKSRLKELSVVIKDIDAITTGEEVEMAVKKELGLSETCFKMGNLRPYFGGNQAVTLRLEEKIARELIAKGKIRIGLCLCQVAERINVDRCYRCWGYGHKKDECREESDRSDACRNCGGQGHVEKACREDPYCLSCRGVGHKAGAGVCPEFKKALSRARLLRKKKRAY